MLTEKEIEIIEGCQKGDSSSQKVLYDTYGPLIKGICRRYTADLDEAEDLFHDVFIFILTHFEQFDNITSLGGWLRQITIHKAIDYLRRRHLWAAVPMSQFEMNLAVDATHEYDGIPMEVLLEFVNQLPKRHRTVFNMHVIDDISQDQISEMLNLSKNNVSTMISRAKDRLRKEIEKYLKNEEYRY
jgi:RNA polymerase sigma-70 factor (ECF subfamily)